MSFLWLWAGLNSYLLLSVSIFKKKCWCRDTWSAPAEGAAASMMNWRPCWLQWCTHIKHVSQFNLICTKGEPYWSINIQAALWTNFPSFADTRYVSYCNEFQHKSFVITPIFSFVSKATIFHSHLEDYTQADPSLAIVSSKLMPLKYSSLHL